MTKDELREVVEAVVASQTAMMDDAFAKLEPLLAPGKFTPGLIFKVEADEVRKMLRSRASSLRSDASEGEKGLSATLEAVGKDFVDAPLPPGTSAEEFIERAKKNTLDEIARLRSEADRVDWQAKHLDERTYMLGMHDLDAILPTQPSSGVDYHLPPYLRTTTRRR